MSQRATRAKKLGATLLASSVAASLSPLLAGPAGAEPADAPDISSFCAAADGNPFSDVDGLSAETVDAIDCIFEAEITLGKTPTTYGPTDNVVRGQMALFLTRLGDKIVELDLPGDPDLTAIPASGPDAFTDDDDSVYEDALNRLAAAGIYQGIGGGLADPVSDMSRAQMALLINRLQAFLATGDADIAGSTFASNVDAFDDDNGLGDAETSFNALGSVGIFRGNGVDMVQPTAAISRAQMALVLARTAAVNHNRGIIDALPGAPTQLAVDPSDAETIVVGETRDFTVSDLDDEEIFRVTLVDCDNISFDDDDNAVFVEDGDTGLALAGANPAALITDVNGDAVTAAQSVGAISPDGGEITFTITGDAEGCVIPVVYGDQGGDNTRLNIDDDGMPEENFGLGGETTVTLPMNVDATDAPELLTITQLEPDVLAFVFDEAVTGQALQLDGDVFFGFRLYDTLGQVTYPTEAVIDGDTVIARFTATAISTAAVATVRFDAVESVTGIPNIEGDVELTPPAIATPAFSPQLTAVGNYRISDELIDGFQRILIDFTFDAAGFVPEFNAGPGQFNVIGALGAEFNGLEFVGNPNGAVVTVALEVENLSDVPESQLRRGFVEGIAFLDQPFVVANAFEETDGNTVDPDLVGVQRVGDVFRFTFDEAVSDVPGELDEARFGVLDIDGNVTFATSVVRSAVPADNATVVNATFPGLPSFGADTPVVAFVDEAAVVATDNVATFNFGRNQPDEEVLTLPADVGLAAGITALPDLLRVERDQNTVTDNFTVRFVFDSGTGQFILNNADLSLYDENGTQFRIEDGTLTCGVDGVTCIGSTISVTTDNPFFGALDNDQIQASVVGGAEDADNFNELNVEVREASVLITDV